MFYPGIVYMYTVIVRCTARPATRSTSAVALLYSSTYHGTRVPGIILDGIDSDIDSDTVTQVTHAALRGVLVLLN